MFKCLLCIIFVQENDIYVYGMKEWFYSNNVNW